MTPNEFKLRYPEHAHLEDDKLWDKMTESLFLQGEVLTADPTQVKQWLKPITLANGVILTLEDSSTTRWLNSKGEVVKLAKEEHLHQQTESYRMEIIDLGKL